MVLASLSQGKEVGFKCSIIASNILSLCSSSHLTIFTVNFERAGGVCEEEGLLKGVRCRVGLWQFECSKVEVDGG